MILMIKQKLMLIFLVVGLLVNRSEAQLYSGAVSAAAGGTGRASVEPGVAGFLNPAMMVHQKGDQLYTSKADDVFVLALTQNSEGAAIPTSIGFWEKDIREGLVGDRAHKVRDFRVSFAEFVRPSWALGATGHYFQVQNSEETWSQTNVDLGILVTPVPEVGLALVLYNLGAGNPEIPEALRIHRTIGLGFNHLYRDYFRSRVDFISGPEQDFHRATIMIGFESYLNRWVLARFGLSSNTYLNQDVSSLGLGLDLPHFRLNYAFQFVAYNSSEQSHSIDLVIPF
jgi:hypothetical protein